MKSVSSLRRILNNADVGNDLVSFRPAMSIAVPERRNSLAP